MDPVVYTSRLKLVLLTKVERGSPEFDRFHELFTNEKSTWWSITGCSKSPEETEMKLGYILPETTSPESYRALYAVYRFTDDNSTMTTGGDPETRPTEFIGEVNVRSLNQGMLALPSHFGPSMSSFASEDSVLPIEIAYMFLPTAWGAGYATESVAAMYTACQRNPEFWSPFKKVNVRAIVNSENPASSRVMQKVGMEKKGIYEWRGKAIFLAGRWREEDTLVIWGRDLFV